MTVLSVDATTSWLGPTSLIPLIPRCALRGRLRAQVWANCRFLDPDDPADVLALAERLLQATHRQASYMQNQDISNGLETERDRGTQGRAGRVKGKDASK